MPYLEQALQKGYVKITGDEKKQKILYVASNHSENYSDPEEKVRAEFWAELVIRYGYEPIDIGIERTVPDRTPRDVADLVVFHKGENTRPYAVIECKRDGITDAEFEQAVEQACGNGTWAKFRADYVGVVAGQTRRFLDFSPKYGILEREVNIVADLPKRYGKPAEFRFKKGTKDDIRPVDRENLIAAIKKCHQTLWGGGRLSPPAAFGELCKIIFVKISDEKKPRRNGQPYEFQIKTRESAHDLGERIRELYQAEKEKDPEVFTDTIRIDDPTLQTIVSHIEGIDFSKTDLDTKGVAFEKFMDSFFKGDFGQYFTPRPIIDFAIKMMLPKNYELVLDPACGSGGFLLHALDHIRHEADSYFPDNETDPEQAKEHREYWHKFARGKLFGIDINDEIARVAKMNMIIHDDGHTNVICDDALDRLNQVRQRSDNNKFKKGVFDLVLTNPPFGAKVFGSERPYLGDYEFGQQQTSSGVKRDRKSQKSEILFIERIWEFLKTGTGRAAVVLPDGVLTNSSLQYVRDFLLDKFQILAVVSLPQTAFAHFGAGVKASIVFFRKRATDEQPSDDEAIFMAAPELIGYDATGRETKNQLDDVVKSYREFEKEPEPFFV